MWTVVKGPYNPSFRIRRKLRKYPKPLSMLREHMSKEAYLRFEAAPVARGVNILREDELDIDTITYEEQVVYINKHARDAVEARRRLKLSL